MVLSSSVNFSGLIFADYSGNNVCVCKPQVITLASLLCKVQRIDSGHLGLCTTPFAQFYNSHKEHFSIESRKQDYIPSGLESNKTWFLWQKVYSYNQELKIWRQHAKKKQPTKGKQNKGESKLRIWII